MESGVEFVAVDFPQANRLTIHILAAVAEHEAKAISSAPRRTGGAKARGRVLGGFRGHAIDDGARRASLATRRAVSAAKAADIAPVIAELRASGVTSLGGIASALRERGIPAPEAARRGRPGKCRGYWHKQRREGQVLTDDMRAAGRAAMVRQSSERAAELASIIAELRASGVKSLRGIARALSERGIPTARGGAVWAGVQVSRVLSKIDAQKYP